MGVVDVAGKTAIAVSLEFSIPVFRGEPNLDADVAVCGGSSLDHDAAKSRKRFKNSCAVGKKRRQFDWQFEGAGWNGFCTENFCLRQREFGEGFAGLGAGERGTRGRKKGSRQDSLHVSLLDYIRDEAPKRENITQRARSSEHGEHGPGPYPERCTWFHDLYGRPQEFLRSR